MCTDERIAETRNTSFANKTLKKRKRNLDVKYVKCAQRKQALNSFQNSVHSSS